MALPLVDFSPEIKGVYSVAVRARSWFEAVGKGVTAMALERTLLVLP